MEDLGTLSSRKKRKPYLPLGVVVIFIWFAYSVLPPGDFPKDSFFTIESGSTLFAVSEKAKIQDIVRSSFLLRTLITLSGGDKAVQAGDYYLDQPMSVFSIANMLATGDFNQKLIRVTFPEGYTRNDMAKVLVNTSLKIPVDEFLKTTSGLEGYLFPDTYFISPTATSTAIVEQMQENYDVKISPYREEITTSGKTEKEIITMASLVEREAQGESDSKIIAGILWNRIERGMALEVDAPFYFLLGKESSELTLSDLKIDSPYNLYTHTGLPPGPIDNPGLSSILASLRPEETSYLFYLHDKNGVAHYAKTFDEHKKNKALYLH